MSQAEILSGDALAEAVATKIASMDPQNVVLLGSPRQRQHLKRIHSFLGVDQRRVASPLNVNGARSHLIAFKGMNREHPAVRAWINESAREGALKGEIERPGIVSAGLVRSAVQLAEQGPVVAVVANIDPEGRTERGGDLESEVAYQQIMALRELGKKVTIFFCQPVPEGSPYHHMTDPLYREENVGVLFRDHQPVTQEPVGTAGVEVTQIIPVIRTTDPMQRAIESGKEGENDE